MRSLAVGAILAGLAAFPLYAQSLDARLPTCYACHGENGTSQLPDIPSLGAQTAFYSMQTRRNFGSASFPSNSIFRFFEDASGRYSFDTTAASTTPPTRAV